MKTITASPDIVLQLGRQGENNARQIVFDITDWKAEFGADGTVALLAQRPRETEPYPVDIVVSGSAVTWLVSAADTAKPGIYGQAELQYRIGDVVVKSAIWRTFVADSLGIPSPEPPEPQQAWVDQVLDAAQTVETATANGPKIQGGTWWVWDFAAGKYVDTGVQAQGKPAEIPFIDLTPYGAVPLDGNPLTVELPEEMVQQFNLAVNSRCGTFHYTLGFLGDLTSTLYMTKAELPDMGEVFSFAGFSSYNIGTISFIFIPNASLAMAANIEILSLPAVSIADDGKTLKVVNGVWTAVEPS